jgi:hypothetical protein
MKKIVPILFLGIVAVCANSCKKCFRCYNECTTCTIAINANSFSKTICSDSFSTAIAYRSAINADTAAGYTCVGSSPSYNREFCTNQPGEESYQNYFNQGKRVVCDPK